MKSDAKNRANELLDEHRREISIRTDRMFAVLLVFQYFVGIVAAVCLSPRTWAGAASSIHVHVQAAAILGLVIISFPLALIRWAPGQTVNRHAVAVAQMLYSALLIHLSGGRIETHFHVFGSLAFLSFYRDWRVLMTASAVVIADHYLRGAYWPVSIYGTVAPGSLRWLEHSGWVVFEDVFLVLAILQSGREMAEMARRRAEMERNEQELARALRTRDTFLSICSHELKTPLTSLRLQAELLAKTVATPEAIVSGDRMGRLTRSTIQQVDRLNRLVDDMLDVTRLGAGKLSLYPEDIELTALVRATIDRLFPEGGDGVPRVKFTPAGPVHGRWDAHRLEQVLINLLTNAQKYGGGKSIRVSVESLGPRAEIRVKDQGPGIAPQDRDRVFGRFERVSQPKGISGLGLGLFITRGIVEQHGGTIRIEGGPGEGSTFVVTLPLESRASSAPPVEPGLSTALESREAGASAGADARA